MPDNRSLHFDSSHKNSPYTNPSSTRPLCAGIDTRFWGIALSRLKGIGPKILFNLLNNFDSAQLALEASEQEWKALGMNINIRAQLAELKRDPINHPCGQQALKDIDWLDQNNASVITWFDANYPALLRELTVPPPLLYVRGNLDLLNKPQIAVIGSRNASVNGLDNAHRLSYQLAQSCFVITSGLALGVDASAHRGALDAKAETIAVLGSGIDQIYPSSNRSLASEIIEQGAIVSEFPLGTQPKRDHFPRRNRIISGMAKGVLVVEAAVKSGSLITARYALEQNREVFAIPGSINNPQAQGCHSLLKDGAILVDSAEDITQVIDPLLDYVPHSPSTIHNPQSSLHPQTSLDLSVTDSDKTDVSDKPNTPSGLNEVESALFSVLGFDPITVDRLVELCRLSASEVASGLIGLELAGLAESGPLGYQKSIT